MKTLKNLFIMLLLAFVPVTAFAGTNSLLPGPNNGQITVQNSSTIITPTQFPARYSITFYNAGSVTVYICQATQKDSTTGFISATLKTCSSSVADIILTSGAAYSSPTSGYAGQFTAITSSSTAVLIISED